jgi:hypothetical protein
MRLKIAKKQIKPPQIVQFGYKNFKIEAEKAKWSATCVYCNKAILETRGTMSGFSRQTYGSIQLLVK